MRLRHALLLLPLLLLTACKSPNITNIQKQVIDNHPINYQKVDKARITITTYSDLTGDLLNQDFGYNGVQIEYLTEGNGVITTEYADTIQKALNQNKNAMTLTIGNGRGTTVTYDADIDGKPESRKHMVPFIAEYNVKNIKTESDLKREIEKNKPTLKYTWTGETNGTIEDIIIRHKDDYTTLESKYQNGKWVVKNVTKTRISEFHYRYENKVLLPVETSTHNQ